MKEERNIPFKNYIILAIVLILSVLGVIYFYMWYGEIKNNKIYTPVMNQYLSVINYNELGTYLIENKDVILYASVLNNEETRNFEKKFKKIVKQYALNDDILYLDLTNEFKDKDLYNSIRDKYNLLDMPCLIVFKNGMIYDVYSIEDRNYDINLLISYLRIEGIIND